MTLLEFLRARLDEDEAAAQAWSTPFSNPTTEQRDHFARHDPARVLAEVEAKRRIVDACADIGETAGPYACALAADALAALGLPYADHPDYDPAWRPE